MYRRALYKWDYHPGRHQIYRTIFHHSRLCARLKAKKPDVARAFKRDIYWGSKRICIDLADGAVWRWLTTGVGDGSSVSVVRTRLQ